MPKKSKRPLSRKRTEGPLERVVGEHGPFVFDYTSSGHRRVTCKCGATLVKQPYMTETDWWVARRQFGRQHMLSNAEVSEGGTRDSRIETAAQSRPSLH